MIESYREPTKMDCEKVEAETIRFIISVVSQAKTDGDVLGLSGGIDSSVVIALRAKALGKEKMIGPFMPTTFTLKDDQIDARVIAEHLGMRIHLIFLDRIVSRLLETVSFGERNRIAVGNALARMRMAISYYFADSLLVGHLYRTQARELRKHLDLPSNIVGKLASPQLWKGQKATEVIPVDYPILDLILSGLFDAKASANDIAKQLGIKLKVVEAVQSLSKRSNHKRTVPPIPPVFESLQPSGSITQES